MLYGKDDIGNKGALMRSLVKFLKKYDLYLNDFKYCYSLERNLKHKNQKTKQSKYKFDQLGKVVRACPMTYMLLQLTFCEEKNCHEWSGPESLSVLLCGKVALSVVTIPFLRFE